MTSPTYIPAADARAAASLLLLRDGADGLEVLMLRRAERSDDLRSGVAVFPGGVLDARDRQAHACCLGPDDAAASRLLGVAQGGLDYYVAALRETFEEVGLLLACSAADPGAGPDLALAQPWRLRMQAGEVGIQDFCRDQGLVLDARELVYFSHWLTPPGQAKRFDTRFFAVAAPPGQLAEADMGEAQELMWLTPDQALDPARGLKLLPVTRRTLQVLGRSASVGDALGAARSRVHDVPLMMPRMAASSRGTRILLPDDLAYAEVARLDPDGRQAASCELLPGRLVRLSERLLRITAPNPGPMTGPGTNSYLVGSGGLWTVVDPGPDSAEHLQALLAALAGLGGRLERIVVTHTHKDHSPAAAALARATGAPVWGRVAPHPDWQDGDFAPDRQPVHGERFSAGPETTLRVLHTPGHASNHLCFLIEEEKTLLTGDHVMQGSTVVINPPDGEMAVYLHSLQSLLDEDLAWFAPGHGFLVARPHEVVRALLAHRQRREQRVLEALAAAAGDLDALLPVVYADTPVPLHPVARRSLLAHLIKLRDDGRVRDDAGVWSGL